MDKLGKIRQHHRKERFKIRKIAEFERDLLKIIAPKSREVYRRLYSGEHNIQTSVNFRNFAELYLRLLKTYHFKIW